MKPSFALYFALNMLKLAVPTADELLPLCSVCECCDEDNNAKLKIFLDNITEIEHHNECFNRGSSSFQMALNSLGELSSKQCTVRNEFCEAMDGLQQEQQIFNEMELYDELDWRDIDAVTDVKDQGGCGSCWAFSVVGAIESQVYLETGQLIRLSEQNLIDCSPDDNRGCRGGSMESAFQLVINNGIAIEDSYPYEGRKGPCRYSQENIGIIRDYGVIQSGNETQLMEAAASIGPIIATIDACLSSLKHYSNGVYYDERCSSTALDHGVLLVGYGTTDDGMDYWIVKNSYGRCWGEDGYFRLARNRGNHCGIASAALYPIV